MAKTNKPISSEEAISILPTLTHEELLKLMTAVDKEHEERIAKASKDLNMLQGNNIKGN